MKIARFFAGLFSEVALAFLLVGLGTAWAVKLTPPPDVSRARQYSQVVTSSNDQILWAFLTQDEKWRLSPDAQNVDPKFIDLLIAYEDKRFWSHGGVDGLALLRAAFQTLRYRHAVSGSSTLTMQVVRMLEPRPRTAAAKIEQILKAIKLERLLDKRHILDLYLSLAPYGGNVEGIRAATLLYLGKEPKRLSLAEAALFVAIPQAPEARRPDRNRSAAQAAKNRVLTTLLARGVIDAKAVAWARHNVSGLGWHPLTVNAAHLSMRLRRAQPGATAIRTLIDKGLQTQVERIAAQAIVKWGDGVNIAVVVIRNRDASVAAYLGGVNYLDAERKGFVDLAQGIRSPGSALKPFVYAMGFENLIVHPDTIITDGPIEIDGYRPDNADGQFAGDISVRQALIRSRNTTAVMILHKVGIAPFLARFRTAGRALLLPPTKVAPGLAVALGGVGVTLEQLTWFYTPFANEGTLRSLRLTPSDPSESVGPFISPTAARATADILADVPSPPGYARLQSVDEGRRIGYKTGTSYGFRDAWAIGFDQLHTVGVWIGRPDGAAHLGAYGATVAAPVMLQIFDRLPKPQHDVADGNTELGALASLRALPNRLARFDQVDQTSVKPLEISFPRNGANIRADRAPDGKVTLPVAANGGTAPYRWTFSGAPQEPTPLSTSKWTLDGRGQFDISITDSAGVVAKSSFWLD